MNVSGPFIARPVATSLLGIAVLLGGLLGYWRAAGLVAAAGRFPDHPGDDAAAGRQSRDHGDRWSPRRWSASSAQIPALAPMTSSASVRHQPDHAAVRPRPRHRRRRAGRAGGDQRGGSHAAAQPALSADLRQGEPGRRADRDAGADLRHDAAARSCSDLADTLIAAAARRRWPASATSRCRAASARRCASRPISRGSPPTASRMEDLRTAIVARQRRRAEGLARRRRSRPTPSPPTTRSPRADAYRRRRRRLAQRRAGAARAMSREVVDGLENTQGRRLVQGQRRPSSSTCSASPAPTSSRRSQRIRARAAAAAARACRRASS